MGGKKTTREVDSLKHDVFFIWRTSWCSIVSYETFRGVPSILHVPHGNCDNLFPRSFHFQICIISFLHKYFDKTAQVVSCLKTAPTHPYSHLCVWTQIGNQLKVNGSWERRIHEIWSLPMRTLSPKSPQSLRSNKPQCHGSKATGKVPLVFVLADLPTGNRGVTKIEWPPWKFNQPWFRRLLERHLQVQEKDTHVQTS